MIAMYVCLMYITSCSIASAQVAIRFCSYNLVFNEAPINNGVMHITKNACLSTMCVQQFSVVVIIQNTQKSQLKEHES